MAFIPETESTLCHCHLNSDAAYMKIHLANLMKTAGDVGNKRGICAARTFFSHRGQKTMESVAADIKEYSNNREYMRAKAKESLKTLRPLLSATKVNRYTLLGNVDVKFAVHIKKKRLGKTPLPSTKQISRAVNECIVPTSNAWVSYNYVLEMPLNHHSRKWMVNAIFLCTVNEGFGWRCCINLNKTIDNTNCASFP